LLRGVDLSQALSESVYKAITPVVSYLGSCSAIIQQCASRASSAPQTLQFNCQEIYLSIMASLLGSTPCAPHTTTRHASKHRLNVRSRPTCPAAFQSNARMQRCSVPRSSRTVVRAAATTQQNVKMPSWEQMHKQLTTQHRLESISPQEAQKLVKSGKFVLVDVRPPDVFEKAHPEGAQSAPLFQSVKWSQPDFKKYLRAIAFMANGVK